MHTAIELHVQLFVFETAQHRLHTVIPFFQHTKAGLVDKDFPAIVGALQFKHVSVDVFPANLFDLVPGNQDFIQV